MFVFGRQRRQFPIVLGPLLLCSQSLLLNFSSVTVRSFEHISRPFFDRHYRSLAIHLSTPSQFSGPVRHFSTTKFRRPKMSTATASPIVLDRSQFNTEVSFLALKVKPSKCSHYLSAWKNFLFKRPKMKSIYNSADNEYRLVVLDEQYQDATLSFAPAALREEHLAEGHGVEPFVMKFGYEHLTVEEVLRKVLPADMAEIPSSFEQAGHIAHMNLRDEALPYKHIIGQVIVDKNPAIRTVVNKTGQIETEFRTFPLEVLAGDNDMVVTLKESNAMFTFNFAEVYWNSRLQMEHSRVIGMIKDSVSRFHQLHAQNGKVWVVADLMGGVGPFAVPLAQAALQTHTLQALHAAPVAASSTADAATAASAASSKPAVAKKGPLQPGMSIHANDLNPASFKYLVINQKSNKVEKSLVPYNLDGRVFLRDLVGRQGIWPDEAIMNLPQNATDFLDVFIGVGHLYDAHHRERGTGLTAEHKKLRIHVYAFSTHLEDAVGDIVRRSAGVLQCSPEEITAATTNAAGEPLESGCLGHVVRDVAPKKVMVCLSFYLPPSVQFAAVGDEKLSGSKRTADQL